MTRKSDQSFIDHLEELRYRIFKVLLAAGLGAVVVFIFLDPILAFLTRPVGELIFLRPTEAFITRLKIGFVLGASLAFPVIIYQFWMFVAPGLYDSEQKTARVIIPLSFLMFIVGTVFGFEAVFPPAMRFLLNAGTESIRPQISFGYYVSFVTAFTLAFGIVFQLPIVIFFLVKLGLVERSFFSRHRKVAVVIILCIAAILTPGPDVFSQLMMAVPTILLFEMSIFLSRFAQPRQENS